MAEVGRVLITSECCWGELGNRSSDVPPEANKTTHECCGGHLVNGQCLFV